MRRLKNTRGITLIALVVTIVVLLILAAVSISMLGGENGIITQAQESKDKTEQAKVQEIVDLAVNTLISENMGSKDGITPKDIADKINEEYSQYENVHAEDEANFPTKIIFPEEGDREVEVDLGISTGNIDNMYDVDVSEEDIAPTEIFKYEIISGAETGATSLDSLPTKEARITGIKEKYCNGFYSDDDIYDAETDKTYSGTNYDIILEDGSKISDTLIIPYQVQIDGEIYKITGCNIYASGYQNGSTMPKIKKLIYPNTIKRISGGSSFTYNNTLCEVVLSNSLQELGVGAFYGCSSLTSIEIPSSVTSMGMFAFYECSSLTSIKIPDSVTSIEYSTFDCCTSLKSIEISNGVTSIGDNAFSDCSSLTSIEIPNSVTSIGDSTFEGCTSLTNIEIPNSVTSIGNRVFYKCSSLTSIKIPDSVTSIEYLTFDGCTSLKSIEIPNSVTSIGDTVFSGCDNLTTINYTGTIAEWRQISIDSSNTYYLDKATIICTDGILNQ